MTRATTNTLIEGKGSGVGGGGGDDDDDDDDDDDNDDGGGSGGGGLFRAKRFNAHGATFFLPPLIGGIGSKKG